MKKTILRLAIGAALLSLISTGIVSIIGLMRGWETSAQYSDGFFWAGAILILIGFISFRGYSYSSTGGLPAKMDSGNRANLWAADAFRGKIFLVLFGISGLLLLGLSILASRLF
jgi:hypothetical protein